MEEDPRKALDTRVDTPQREGLTGTAPISMYRPVIDTDEITRAPDGRPLDAQPKWRRDFPIDAPQDLKGCFSYAFRFTGCFSILYIIMFAAIFCAAVISLLFFR